MRSVIFQACTLALSLGVLTQSHQAAAASLLLPIRVLGFDPTEYSQLAGPTFACADGSRLIPLARVNDDNCDCADGSDERGTAACAHLSSAPAFVCLNPGYLSERIPTSRVADGICDCCDGADERDAPTKCPNTCASRRASAEAAVAERLSGLRAGVSARTSLVAEATATRAAAAARVETLEAELVAADARTADLQSALTAEEAKEKEANDVARAAFAAEQEQRRAALEAAAAPVVAEVESVQQLLKDIEREAAPVAEEEEQEDDGIDLDAMLEEAMRNNGIIPASDEADANADAAVAKETAAAAAGTAATNEGEGDGEIFFPYPKEYQPGYEAKKAVAEAEAEAAAAAAAEAEAEETEAEASAAPVAAAAAAHTETFTPIETPEAAQLRSDLSAAQAAAKTTRSALAAEQTKRDALAAEREQPFYALSGKCFSVQQAQYTYEMCFFGKATQREGDRAHGTALGSMKELTWDAADPTRAKAVFSGGQSCWRGPQRSLTVSMTCGAETRATAVDEPSMCEYTMQLETPALCGQAQVDAIVAAMQGAFNGYDAVPPAVPAAAAAAAAATAGASAKDEL